MGVSDIRVTFVRPMESADVFAILAIEAEANPSPWKLSDFHIFLPTSKKGDAGGEHKAWVYSDPEVRGFICAVGIADEVELQAIAVEKAKWSAGLGRALMESMETWARENGYHNLHLEVRESNVRAIQFYHRLGFQSVGRRVNYYQNNLEAAILMSRVI